MTPGPRRRPAARGSHGPPGPAAQAWLLMQQFVDEHSRHGELADAVGFRLGAGRGKILFQLGDGPRTLSDLAAANGFDRPYTTLVVDQLEAHGLVERQPHPDDRRRKLVTLTTAGEAAVATATQIRSRPPQAISALPAPQQRQVIELFSRLVEHDGAGRDQR